MCCICNSFIAIKISRSLYIVVEHPKLSSNSLAKFDRLVKTWSIVSNRKFISLFNLYNCKKLWIQSWIPCFCLVSAVIISAYKRVIVTPPSKKPNLYLLTTLVNNTNNVSNFWCQLFLRLTPCWFFPNSMQLDSYRKFISANFFLSLYFKNQKSEKKTRSQS